MKSTKQSILLTILLLGVSAVFAQQSKSYEPNSYYYNQARQSLDNYDYPTAYDYLNKELAQNSTNGHAYFWRGYIECLYYYDFSSSINSFNLAIKTIPKKDKTFLSSAYACRSLSYQYIGDTVSAYNDASTAIKLSPKDARRYVGRGDLLYSYGNYESALKDYLTALNLNPYNTDAQLGVGKVYQKVSAHKECLEWLGRCIALNPEKSEFYAIRALCYDEMEDYAKEAKDVVKALSIDNNRTALYLLDDLAKKAYNQIIAELKIQQKSEIDNSIWTYFIGNVNEEAGKYDKALFVYKELYDKNDEGKSAAAERIAACWAELGDYDMAVDFQEEAIELEDDEDDRDALYYSLAAYHESIGEYKEAIECINKYIDAFPKSFAGYSKRAWIKRYASYPITEVIEDYDMSIVLAPEYAYHYHQRGEMYNSIGKSVKAREDFNKTVELSSKAETYSDYSAAAYSYHSLGNDNDAKKMIRKALELDEESANYEAACLYSLMNETDRAVKYFEYSLQGGNRSFYHFSRDIDLDNIRDLPRFKDLIKEYETKMEDELDKIYREFFGDDKVGMVIVGQERTQEIPYRKTGGVYEIPCTVNDLPLRFIFDTGAADVTISSVEAAFMLKNGYLSPRDVLGSRNYMTASGDIAEGTVIVLRKVGIGDAVLENVRASVVRNQNAPLLLGQTALGQLGKIEIDNTKKVLRVTWKDKK